MGLSQKAGATWKLPARLTDRLRGHVVLGDADAVGLAAVDVEAKLGIVARLLQAHVGDAGDMAQSCRPAHAHRPRSPSRSGPVTCTSIGAGAPKFRIWLMMSAGRNEKVEPGKASGSVVAQLPDITGGRLVVLR